MVPEKEPGQVLKPELGSVPAQELGLVEDRAREPAEELGWAAGQELVKLLQWEALGQKPEKAAGRAPVTLLWLQPASQAEKPSESLLVRLL